MQDPQLEQLHRFAKVLGWVTFVLLLCGASVVLHLAVLGWLVSTCTSN